MRIDTMIALKRCSGNDLFLLLKKLVGKEDFKERSFNEKKELELIEMHPADGVKHLLAAWRLNDVSIISMLTAFEHHLKLDFSGYPRLSGKRKLNLFSRIIEIADDYDSFVSGKVYTRAAQRLSQALKDMLEKSGVYYDSVLLKAFSDIFTSLA